MEYEDFILQIGSDRGDGYPLQVLKSPAGEGRGRLKLSLNADQFNAILMSREPRVRSAAVVAHSDRDFRPILPEPVQRLTAQEVGDQLFRGLFSGQIRSLYDQSLGTIGSRPGRGLRIKLKFDVRDSELTHLVSMPWEFLWRSETQDFLSLSRLSPVVRYLDVPRPVSPITLGSSLRILVVTSSPRGLTPLDLEKEKKNLESACKTWKGVETSFLNDASASAVRSKLLEEDFNVLHFMGHGGFDPSSGEGVLHFTAPGGTPEALTGQALATMLKDFKTLGLVFLNACDTAKTGGAEIAPFSGVAGALVLGGLPAVVAMQYPISDRAAIAFSSAFYQRLALGDSVDAAVVEGRQAILSVNAGSLEWGTPVLFLRVPDAAVFQSRRKGRPKTKAVMACLLAAALTGAGIPAFQWLIRQAPNTQPAVPAGRFLEIGQTFESSINGLTGTLRSVEILPNGRMRLRFRFKNASPKSVGLGFDYRSTYLADEQGNRYDVLATDTDKETTIDSIPPGQEIDRWMDFPGPLDNARSFHVGLEGREILQFPLFNVRFPAYSPEISRMTPTPKPLPDSQALAVEQSFATNIEGLESEVRNVTMLPDGRMRWSFAFLNRSGRNQSLGFDYSRIYLEDYRGNRYPILGSDTGGRPGQVYQGSLPRALRKDHWFDFPAPFDGARSFTVVLVSHDWRSLKFLPFHVQIPYYPLRYSVQSQRPKAQTPAAKEKSKVESPPVVSSEPLSISPEPVEEKAAPRPEPKEEPIEPQRSPVSSVQKAFTTSIEGVNGRMTGIERLSDGRLRWSFEFLNQSQGHLYIGFNAEATYLADNKGNRYRVLHMSTSGQQSVSVGARLLVWFEFAAPASGAKIFTVVLISHAPDFLRVIPFQVELPSKGS